MGDRAQHLTVALIGSLLVVGGYSLKGNVIDTQFSLYTSSGQTVRAQLYSTGERIATTTSPWGSGSGDSPAIHRVCTTARSMTNTS